MDKVALRFYTHELQEHNMLSLHEWLLILANRLGIPAGNAVLALAGYSRFSHPSSRRANELIVNRAIVVEFIASEADADKLLAFLVEEGVELSYTRHPIEYHEIGSRP